LFAIGYSFDCFSCTWRGSCEIRIPYNFRS